MSDLTQLRDAMRSFTSARDWERFHDPKSLVLALLGEAGELAAEFQWLPAEGAVSVVSEEPRRTAVADELADVLDIDLRAAAEAKLVKNAVKHPAGGS